MTMTAQSTSSEFRSYIDQYQSLPPEVILGFIVWFGVADAAYDGDHIAAEFDRLNLNKAFLPNALNPADAYEKATKCIDGTKYDVVGGLTAEIMVRELGRDSQRVVRKIIREVKDANGQRLLYDEVGDLVFYKPQVRGGVIDYSTAAVRTTVGQGVSESERAMLVSLFGKFNDSYAKHCRFHDGQKIRALVRNYLLHLNAIMMKPTVYFVHNNRTDELQRLQTFVRGLRIDKTSMTLLPQVDLPALREDVVEAFEREAEKDFMEVFTDIAKLNETRKGAPSMEAYTKMRQQFDLVDQKAGEHARTLQVTAAVATAAKDMARAALQQLQEKVIAEAMKNAT